MAIVPQVYLVSKAKQVESIVVSYIACMGLYRGCYLMHWAYLYYKQQQLEEIAIASSIVQLIFYVDFFARNLPIIKPKHRSTDLTQNEGTNVESIVVKNVETVGDKEVQGRLLIVDCKNNQQLKGATSSVAKEDRVSRLK